MQIFLSGEVDTQVDTYFFEVRKDISQKLKTLETNNYGDNVEKIAIIPIIFHDLELESAGFFEERKLFRKKAADIRLKINFEKFRNGDYQARTLLLLRNIIDAIKWLDSKVKDGFNGKNLEIDIINLFDIKVDKNGNF